MDNESIKIKIQDQDEISGTEKLNKNENKGGNDMENENTENTENVENNGIFNSVFHQLPTCGNRARIREKTGFQHFPHPLILLLL